MIRKKISLLALLLGASFYTEQAQAQYGYIKAGLNFNNARVRDINTGEKLKAGINAGMHDYFIGAGYGLKIKDVVYLQFGLDWMSRGYKNKFAAPWQRNDYYAALYANLENRRSKIRTYYFGFPLTASYYFNISNHRFFVQGGVYGALGVFGSEHISGKFEGKEFKEEFGGIFLGGDFQGNNEALSDVIVTKQRPDNGLILGVGYEIGDFQVGLQYQGGLANVNKAYFDLRYRTVSLFLLVNIDMRDKPEPNKQ